MVRVKLKNGTSVEIQLELIGDMKENNNSGIRIR